MYVTCKCLNIILRIKDKNNIKEFHNENQLKLSDDEQNHEFLSNPNTNNLLILEDCQFIKMKQNSLVIKKNIGLWIIYYCINCLHYTYGIKLTTASSTLISNDNCNNQKVILINKNNKILDINDYEKIIKSNPNYSSIYEIIINNNNNDYTNEKNINSYNDNVQLLITNIKKQLDEAIENETLIIEEKIHEFTNQQHQLLELYCQKAYSDYERLENIIYQSQISMFDNYRENNDLSPISNNEKVKKLVTKSDSVDYPITSSNDSENLKTQHANKQQFSTLNIKSSDVINNKPIYNQVKSTENQIGLPMTYDNYDAEGMFPLEGDDFSSDNPVQSENEPDTDDSGQDEGIHIPRGQRGGHPTLAKSLPVSVPNFHAFARRMKDQDKDQLSMDPLDPHNIRASIKALAKSVHGDTVFGDLPRPRFSTQI